MAVLRVPPSLRACIAAACLSRVASAPSSSSTASPTQAPTDYSYSYSFDFFFTDAPTPLPSFAPTTAPVSTGSAISDLWGFQDGTPGTDVAYAAVRESDVVYVAGQWQGTSNASKLFVAALTSDAGDTVWGPIINGSDSEESIALSIAVNGTSGVVAAAGYTTGALYANSSAGKEDLFILELDSASGAVLQGWQGGSSGSDKILAIVMASGDYIIGGSTSGALCSSSNASASAGVAEPFVARLASSFLASDAKFATAEDWCISGSDLAGTGDGGAVNGLALSSDGLSVSAAGSVTDSLGSVTGFVVQLSVDTGELLWAMNGAAGEMLSVAVGTDNATYIVGYTNDSSAATILAQRLYGDNGTVVWTYGVANASENATSALYGTAYSAGLLDTDLSLVITGVDTADAAFVLELDASDGSELCYYSFAASNYEATIGFAVTTATDGSSDITVSGSTSGALVAANSGGADVYTVAFDLTDTNVCPATTDSTGFVSKATGGTSGTAVSVVAAISGVAAITAAVVSGGAASGGVVAGGATAGVVAGSGVSTTQVSATSSIGGLMVAQIQFMAVLALVDQNGQSDGFASFVNKLKWSQLWYSWERASGCAADETSGVGGSVFLGQTVLAVLGLLIIFLLHMLIISAVEAWWIARDAASVVVHDAANQGVTVQQLEDLNVVPVATLNKSGIASVSVRGDFTNNSATNSENAAANSASAAQDSGFSPARSSTAIPPPIIAAENEELVAPAPDNVPFGRAFGDNGANGASGEAAAAGEGAVDPRAPAFERSGAHSPTRGIYRYESRVDPYEHVTKRSHSIWLFWPHIELLYLFYIFSGALTAQASMFRAHCQWLRTLAIVLFVCFPLLIVLFVLIVCVRRIRSRDEAAVTYVAEEGHEGAGVLRKIVIGWRGAIMRGTSFLDPFERGHWESASSGSRAADEFRIGFEPVYAEYSANTVYYIVFRLAKALAVGLVAALLVAASLQTGLLFLLHLLDLFVLAWLRPFSNSAVNVLEACMVIIDAASMGATFVAIEMGDKSNSVGRHRTWDAVMMMQMGCLVLITIPLWIDFGLIVFHAIRKKIFRSGREVYARSGEREPTEAEARAEWVKRRAKHTWFKYWGVMVRRNLRACGGNTFSPVVGRGGYHGPTSSGQQPRGANHEGSGGNESGGATAGRNDGLQKGNSLAFLKDVTPKAHITPRAETAPHRRLLPPSE